MKTRPVRVQKPNGADGAGGDSRRFTVNILSDDPALPERLARESRRNPALALQFGAAAADGGRSFAAQLLPAADLLAAPKTPRGRGSLLLAFGPVELLPACFLAGCDDYLKEPWTLAELEWRLRRLLPDTTRRYRFPWGSFTLRNLALVSARGSRPLSWPELRILRLLADQRSQVVPRQALYYAIWGRDDRRGSRVADVHVSRLRRKLLELFPGSGGALRAVRGQGYLLQ